MKCYSYTSTHLNYSYVSELLKCRSRKRGCRWFVCCLFVSLCWYASEEKWGEI